jgi:hypothetical protein
MKTIDLGMRQPANAGIVQPSIWAVDYKRKRCDVFDGEAYRKFPSLVEVARAAAPLGVKTILTERNFANFEVATRGEVIKSIEDMGIDLLTIHAGQTARERKKIGLTKTDKNDAKVIYGMYLRGAHFKRATVVEDDWRDFSAEVNTQAIEDRDRGKKDTINGMVFDMIGKEAMQIHAPCFVNKDGKPSSALAAVYYAAMKTATRTRFERLLGLYGNGHACLLRSDIYHWGYRRNRGTVTLREFRRQIRWLRSQIKARAWSNPPTRA